MLLLMDVGNTHIVIGVVEGEEMIYQWRIHTDRDKTEDEYGMLIHNLFYQQGLSAAHFGGVVLSSVVPPLTHVLTMMAEKYVGMTPLVVGPGVKTGLNIQYENPREVGADRIANAVAAIELYGAPVIVVDFGTATTFCFIDERGHYIGGAITPGVNISTEALYRSAAQLTRVQIVKPESVVGRNTIKAVQAGIFYGYVGVVDGVVSRMKKELTVKPTVVATGGLAELICDETKTIDVIHSSLTLVGLRLIYERNREGMVYHKDK
ncbi:type III pantothenate kinase [Mechercharimyces sp. CAU 1602]|uniref:type III pantothenate kinase n=1 Tax=Mechercharimyces sp. CAU 1602 TaxID=2973933 RepID=UPI00216327BA|nr:type III pantothenate kinase [Mechercharimyces sp. CAU 1602]MCS1352395.1 type III pantothenate kinase [Mechercharimyces sp. CAU 1602]